MLSKDDALKLTEAAIETENVACCERYQKFAMAIENVIEIKAKLGLKVCHFTLQEKDYPTARCIADELKVRGFNVTVGQSKCGYNLTIEW